METGLYALYVPTGEKETRKTRTAIKHETWQQQARQQHQQQQQRERDKRREGRDRENEAVFL